MGYPDSDMCVKSSVTIPTVYTEGSTCDESNAAGQAVVKVAATTNFSATDNALGHRVVIGRGTAREEQGTVLSIQAGTSITLDANLTKNHTVDAATTVDVESAAAQAVLSVTATTNFLAGETVIVDVGESHAATYIILSVQDAVSLTMTTNLLFTHEVAETVTQAGVANIVEVCMASLSTVLTKSHYKYMAIFLPSTWTTAAITFVGCDTPDGTFNQLINSTDVGEVIIASVAASKVIALDGECLEAMVTIPYIKLRSGTAVAPVDQGAENVSIGYVLKR